MLTGFCGRGGDCTGYCPDCYEEKGEDMEGEFESCDIGHERIIYFSGRCPLCEALIARQQALDNLELATEQLEEIIRLTDTEVVIP